MKICSVVFHCNILLRGTDFHRGSPEINQHFFTEQIIIKGRLKIAYETASLTLLIV